MKKLFFAALLATVAVGGAFATDYSTQADSQGIKFRCENIDEPTCEASAPTGVNQIYVLGSSTPTTLPVAEYDLQYSVLP